MLQLQLKLQKKLYLKPSKIASTLIFSVQNEDLNDDDLDKIIFH